MARANTLMYTASVLQLAPIIAALAARTGFAGPRRWITGWFLLAIGFDVLQRVLGQSALNNLWTAYLGSTLLGTAALCAMGGWQSNDVARTAVRLMVPLSLVAAGLLFFVVENSARFSLVVNPMYGLLVLSVAVFTMGSRGLHEDEPLLRQEWFWISGGLALYYGATAAVSPLGAILVPEHPGTYVKALTLQAATNIVAYVFVTIGFLCRTPRPSGASSPPSPSAWRSSWSPSERPS